MNWSKLKMLRGLVPVILIGIILFQGQRELRNLSLRDALETMGQLSVWQIALTLLFALAAVAVMTGYDYFLLHSLDVTIPKRRLWRVAWITNSMNGLLGFGGLIGIALRTTMYQQYLDTKRLLKAIGWMTPSLISGLSILSFFVLIGVLPVEALIESKKWLIFVLIGIAAALPIYLWTTLKRSNGVAARTVFGYVGTSLAEWLLAGLLSSYILHVLGAQASVAVTLGVFIVAATAGVVSMIPGGVGTFDLLYLVGMQQAGIDQRLALSALLVFRVTYYIMPFVLALVLASIEFSGTALKQIEGKPFIGPSYEVGTVVFRFVARLIAKAGKLVLGGLVFGLSLVIWFYSLFPAVAPPFDTSRVLQVVGTILLLSAGVILMLSTYGLFQQTIRTAILTCVAISFGVLGSAFRGGNIIEIVLFLLLLLVLLVLRKQFIRQRTLITLSRLVRSLFYMSGYVGLYALFLTELSMLEGIEDVFSRTEGWWVITGTLVLSNVTILVGIQLFNHFYHPDFGDVFDEERFREFSDRYETSALTKLVYMGDKRMYYAEGDRACLAFALSGNRAVVLGEVQGEHGAKEKLLLRFLDEVDHLGYSPMFYQITPGSMPRLHDLGFSFFKLGEEAIVPVDEFSLSGKKRSSMRALNNQLLKAGYTFEVIDDPTVEQIEELRGISDAWLGKRREKGFSLGFFDPDALRHYQLALMKNGEGEAVGFLTLLPGGRGELNVDLMRTATSAPNGLMDVMFIQLIEWAKRSDVARVGLGVAPLAAVGEHERSFWQERVAADVFNDIRYLYRFSGLRKFKGKFNPTWEGRYLAFRSRRTLAVSLYRVARLISRKTSRFPLR